jgi:hypothetical protein
VTEVNGTRGASLAEGAAARSYADRVTDDLGVDGWLTLPDVAERIGTDVGRVRRLVEDRHLLALRGDDGILRVPERFLVPAGEAWEPIPALRGTLVLLADAGFSDAEAVRWLFTPDPSLARRGDPAEPAPRPVDALVAGQKSEIRRRAQALAL